MAVYNGAKYLHEGVEGILKQSYHDFELLIIDDGSTDRSAEIAQSFQDRRIKLVHNPRNMGLTRSLNRGLRLAGGDLIARQDADDVSEPQRLERQVAFLDAHPEVALVGSWYTAIDGEGRKIRRATKPCDHLDICWALFFYSPFVHSAVMFRRDVVLEQLGGYDESWPTSQDYELWTRIVRRWPVANLAEYLIRWRIHSASVTAHAGSRAQLGHRMRVAGVADRLDWQDQPFRLQEQRFAAMSNLWEGSTKGVQVDDVIRAADDLFRLHTAFCREHGLSVDEVGRREEALRARVAENLTVAAMSFRRTDLIRDLIARAVEIHRPSVFRRRTAWRAGKRLVRTLLSPSGQ